MDEYESQNQVLVDYGTTVEKFQEPIKQSQMDIMSQNNDPKPEKHELKDLFTIDELIRMVDILMKHELKNAIISLNINCVNL